MKKTLFRLFAVLALAFAAVGCSQIDTGNVGLQTVRGQIKQEVLNAGTHLTPMTSVTEVCGTEMPLQLSDLKPQTNDKINLADLDIDFYVQIEGGKAPVIATKWPSDRQDVKGEDCTRLGMNYVTRQAREAIYDVVSKFNSATIHTERTAIAAGGVKALQSSLDAEAGKGLFFVRSANVRNLVTDPALEANIKAAANAQFELQKEENQLKVTRVQAERKREEARGNADAVRINAEAVAKAGGKEYIELEAIKKWNGVLPQFNGGGVTPFVNVGK